MKRKFSALYCLGLLCYLMHKLLTAQAFGATASTADKVMMITPVAD